MEVIYGLIPGVILVGLIAVGVLLWAARSGQFDDLEGEAHRILMDDDDKQESEERQPSQAEQSVEHGKRDAKGDPGDK